MKNKTIVLLLLTLLFTISCRHVIEKEITNYQYFDVLESDTLGKAILFAITGEEIPQYGSKVAYVNRIGDTIIPFGKFAYYGSDSLVYYANVMEYNGKEYGRKIAINRKQEILFEFVTFDIFPDPFYEGLTRVLRNGKMGYASKYGKVVIPCVYDYAHWFENGKAEVTFEAEIYLDMEEHKRVESDEWFEIDKKGNKIKNAP